MKKELVLTPPLLGFAIVTRAAAAFGVGLLVASRIPASRRRKIAFGLIGLGAATTPPLLRAIFGRRHDHAAEVLLSETVIESY